MCGVRRRSSASQIRVFENERSDSQPKAPKSSHIERLELRRDVHRHARHLSELKRKQHDVLLSLYRRTWRTIEISAQKCATANGRATICESARARPEAPVDVTFGHFEAHVANAVVPNARLCARYTSPDVSGRVFSQTHRVTCAVVRCRRRTSENVSFANKCPSSSLWWLSIEAIFARR